METKDDSLHPVALDCIQNLTSTYERGYRLDRATLYFVTGVIRALSEENAELKARDRKEDGRSQWEEEN